MITLILKTIKDRWVTIAIFLLISVAFNWMYVALYPSMAEQSEQLTQAFASYPQEFMKAFGIEDAGSMLSSIEGFLSAENYSFMWPILMISLVVSYTAGSLAGEIERGTIEFLLAQPLSRAKIFLSKYISGLLILIAFTGVSVYSVIPLAEMIGVEYRLELHNTIALIALLFSWAIYSLGMMFSAILSERGRVSFLMIGLLVLMYVLNLVATLQSDFDDLKYGSFFHYYDYVGALLKNNISELSVYVFAAVILVSFIVGLNWFVRRDIAV